MKLVFPGGEHPQVLLGLGVNRVGSDPDANIVIDRPGVQPQHCQLHVSATGVMLDVPHGIAVSVNGRRVDGLIALRPGDNMAFDHVQAQLAALETATSIRSQAEVHAVAAANDDPGVTAVRTVLPRYVLRGQAGGSAFGQSYPLHGAVTVGRSMECQLRLDEAGLSRRHARLLPTDNGVQVEDLGSTNGTYINGKRVLRGEARIGDEIAFDTLRLRVVTPGTPVEPVQVHAIPTPARARVASVQRQTWLWIGVAALLAASALAGLLLLR